MAISLFWQRIGSNGTGLVQTEKDGFNWQRMGQSGYHVMAISLNWHRIGSSGTGLVNQHSIGKLVVHWMNWFISGLAPRSFPFNKGKRPRSQP